MPAVTEQGANDSNDAESPRFWCGSDVSAQLREARPDRPAFRRVGPWVAVVDGAIGSRAGMADHPVSRSPAIGRACADELVDEAEQHQPVPESSRARAAGRFRPAYAAGLVPWPPKLLLPAHLVKTLGRDRWRAIMIHELAHIRRGDHWVSRLELVAGLIWWWNPDLLAGPQSARRRGRARLRRLGGLDLAQRPPCVCRGAFRCLFSPIHGQGAGARVGRRRLGPIL